MTTNIEDQIKEILSQSKDSIAESIKEKLSCDLHNSIAFKARNELEKATQDFVQDHIVPEIVKMLLDSKEEIISEIQKGIIGVAGEVAKAMVATSSKKLAGDGYYAKKILQQIFD